MQEIDSGSVSSVAELRRVMLDFEMKYFSQDLKRLHKDILYAFFNILGDETDGMVSSETIRKSPYCRGVSQATYNRALKALIDKGHIEKLVDIPGYYCLNPQSLVQDAAKTNDPCSVPEGLSGQDMEAPALAM